MDYVYKKRAKCHLKIHKIDDNSTAGHEGGDFYTIYDTYG